MHYTREKDEYSCRAKECPVNFFISKNHLEIKDDNIDFCEKCIFQELYAEIGRYEDKRREDEALIKTNLINSAEKPAELLWSTQPDMYTWTLPFAVGNKKEEIYVSSAPTAWTAKLDDCTCHIDGTAVKGCGM